MNSADRIKYRPDIDGLRGIAVTSVVLNHLAETIVPGGYVGVDIFFVISGYLITSQVYKELIQGSFSFRHFYKRRINRIVPALVTVITATLIIGFFLLSPADLTRLANSAAYAMAGLSNVYLWLEYGDYFSSTSQEAPLLHTWTLGIEEQFYIIWPLIIVLLFKFARQFMSSLIFILILAGIVLSEIAIGFFASASYFLIPTRFFELMIGGLLALMLEHRQTNSRTLAQLSFYLGLMLIGYSLFGLQSNSKFPGINALWPCLGTAMLIFSGSSQHPVSRVLTWRPLVFLGLISYSLYLWHWPIIAYLNYIGVKIGSIVGIAIFVIATVLAWFSWRYIERPWRKAGASMSFQQVFLGRFSLPLVLIAAICLASNQFNGFSTRFDPRVAQFEQTLKARPEDLRRGCHVPSALFNTPPDPDNCRLGVDKLPLNGILIGDSFANHFTGMVDVMAKDEGLALMDYTMDGCPPILGYITNNSESYARRCSQRNQIVYQLIRKQGYQRVVLAARWPQQTETSRLLIQSIETILNTGARLSLILSNEPIERADSCIIRKLMYGSKDNCDALRQGPPQYIATIQTLYPQIHIVDPNQVLCSGDICSPILDDTLLYRDSRHLNDVGSRMIGNRLKDSGTKL